jgi:hypothetical protein
LLILSFILISFQEMGIVKAESTIYIRPDGAVERTDKFKEMETSTLEFQMLVAQLLWKEIMLF